MAAQRSAPGATVAQTPLAALLRMSAGLCYALVVLLLQMKYLTTVAGNIETHRSSRRAQPKLSDKYLSVSMSPVRSSCWSAVRVIKLYAKPYSRVS